MSFSWIFPPVTNPGNNESSKLMEHGQLRNSYISFLLPLKVHVLGNQSMVPVNGFPIWGFLVCAIPSDPDGISCRCGRREVSGAGNGKSRM